jgi:hypothetical protein
MVRDTETDDLLSDAWVVHRYRLQDGLVARMAVEDLSA